MLRRLYKRITRPRWMVLVYFSSPEHPDDNLVDTHFHRTWFGAYLRQQDSARWSIWRQTWGVIERVEYAC